MCCFIDNQCKTRENRSSKIFVKVLYVSLISLKVVSDTFLLVCFLSLTGENVFYFTSKALFVLKKIKF